MTRDKTYHADERQLADAGASNPVEEMGKRRPGRPSLSNEELLDKALDLFLDKGFDGTSIDAITVNAGMAKRTVYARYGDKTRLFKAALSRAIDEWIIPIERLRALEEEDFASTLIAIGDALVANVRSPSGLRLMRLTNAESVRMPEISAENVRLGTAPTIDYLTDLLARRANLDTDVAQQAGQAFINLIVAGPANSAAWGVELDLEAVRRQTRYGVRVFLNGIYSREPTVDPQVTRLIAEAGARLDEARQILK